MKVIKIRNKKGQYYLIAAMVIITILSVFISTSNYSKIVSQENINKEGESLQIESEKLMDYILLNGDEKNKDFIKDYKKYLGENYRIYYLIKKEDLILYNDEFNKMEGDYLKETNKKINIQIPIKENELINYSFNLKKGNNLYYIMIKEKGEEIYTYSNEI